MVRTGPTAARQAVEAKINHRATITFTRTRIVGSAGKTGREVERETRCRNDRRLSGRPIVGVRSICTNQGIRLQRDDLELRRLNNMSPTPPPPAARAMKAQEPWRRSCQ